MSFKVTAPVMRLQARCSSVRGGMVKSRADTLTVSNREPCPQCPLVLIHHLPLGDLSGSETLSAPVSAFAVCTVQAFWNGAWG